MHGVVDIDGTLGSVAEARVSVLDRGFLYGDSAFEVMRTYARRAFRQRAHLERLQRSCALVRMTLPVSLEVLERRVERAIAACDRDDCYVRVAVTRGVGPLGLDLSLARHPSVLVYALELTPPRAELYRDGIALASVHVGRSTDGTPAAGAKHGNYLASVLALDDAHARGADDALLLGAHGEVLEGATSNVFALREGRLTTPPLSAGLLDGITRSVVFEMAAELGIPCSEGQLFPRDLCAADEVILTSSVRELVPVVRVDEAPVGDGRPGPVFQRLRSAYRAKTAA